MTFVLYILGGWLLLVMAVLVAVAVVILRAPNLPSTPAQPSDFGTDQLGEGSGRAFHHANGDINV